MAINKENIVLKHGIEWCTEDIEKNTCQICVEVDLSYDFVNTYEEMINDTMTCQCNLDCRCECTCEDEDDRECYCYCDCEDNNFNDPDKCRSECFADCDCYDCTCGYEDCDGYCVECDCGYTDDMEEAIETANTDIMENIANYNRESNSWSLFDSPSYINTHCRYSIEDLEKIWFNLKKATNIVKCRDIIHVNTLTNKLFFTKNDRLSIS